MIGEASLLVNGDDGAVFFNEAVDDAEDSIDSLGCDVGFTDKCVTGIDGGIFTFALSAPGETE